MIDIGSVARTTCPNSAACPHDIEQHRYEPDRERWVCTDNDCRENPYRVIRMPYPETFMGGSWFLEQIRTAYPEATLEYCEYPTIGTEESRWARRRRLGLRWWQREGR